jgi:hypothetical protein
MTRFPLALVALALAATPAAAAPPRITDDAGDWAVASQDVLAVRIERATLDGRPAVRTVLTLAAAPDPGGAYYAFVSLGCEEWTLGSEYAARQEPFLERTACGADPNALPVYEPATMTTSGNEVAFVAALPAGAKGRAVDGIGARTALGSPTGVVVQSMWLLNGDLALGSVRHRL